MNKIWKQGLRSILVLGLCVMLMMAGGCGDDDDDDDNGFGTDTTPNAFSFTPQVNVALSTAVTSNSITVSGIDAPTPITVTGGTYSINGGTFGSTAGTVTNGQSVAVRHTSSATNNTMTTTTLSIGGVTAPFTTFTLPGTGQVIAPAAFSFTPLTGTALSRSLTSNAVTVTGINAPAPIFIQGGTYSINGGTFTSNPGTVLVGQTVVVRQTSSATNDAPTTATLTIGGVSRDFTTRTFQTGGTTTTPNAFTFTNMTSVALNTAVTSAPITVSGITAPAPISVSNGSAYSIGTDPFVSTPGTVTNNQTVRVQHISSSTVATPVITTLNIGGITAQFTSTTAGVADTTPNAFTFTNMTSVAVSTQVTSAPITVLGINAPAPISVSNGSSYSIGAGPFVSTAGTVTNAQTVRVQHTSSATNNTATNTVLTIGGVSATFTSTTEAPVVNAFAVYQTRAVQGTTNTCADCHMLGTLDTTPGGTAPGSENGPDLAGTSTIIMNLRFPNPGSPGHFGIILSAEEITALTALFQAQ